MERLTASGTFAEYMSTAHTLDLYSLKPALEPCGGCLSNVQETCTGRRLCTGTDIV